MTRSVPPADPGHPHGPTPLTEAGDRPGPLAWLLLLPIHLYRRYFSALTGQNCRYFPTCSSYAVTALTRHGVLKGTLLAVWRLLRCNPWSRGGSDRVPARGRWKPDPYVAPPDPADEAPAEGAGDAGGAAARQEAPGGTAEDRRLVRGTPSAARDVKES